MIYKYLRYFARLILKFFTVQVSVKGIENFPSTGPVLIASNHPNSFFDAIVVSCQLKRPVYSLARGDAFKKNWVKKFLSKINMMPIYRISEGKENLTKNDETFEKCFGVFKNNGVVLIFSEGLCVHQKELLPLKKGTARLVNQSWVEGSDVVVVPVGVNYNNFTGFGKRIQINFGTPIVKNSYSELLEQPGAFVRSINQELTSRIGSLISEVKISNSFFSLFIYYLGWVLHFPLYLILMSFVKSKTKGTVFYDSVLYGLIYFLFPIYWLIIILSLYWIF